VRSLTINVLFNKQCNIEILKLTTKCQKILTLQIHAVYKYTAITHELIQRSTS